MKKLLCLLCSLVLCASPVKAASPVVEKHYDVVVCGAEPEGIAAAVSAARNNMSVLLIEDGDKPGGLYTSGMLSMLDLNFNDNGQQVNQGFFMEIYNAIGRDGGFDIAEATTYFRNLLNRNKVDTLYNVTNVNPTVDKGSVKAVTFNYGSRQVRANATYFIDAMLEAPVARKAGADYIYGREDLGLDKCAAATLVFSVKGANWNKVRSYLRNDGNSSTGANNTSAWGYAELRNYQPVTDKEKFQLRGLNIAREKDGSLVINAFQIFDVDATSNQSKKDAYEKAKKELPHIIKYLNQNAVGFENATLDKVADELYIREGVRIVGEETLTVEDSFQNRNFNNKIAYGSYAIDLQSASKDNYGGNALISRNVYTVPMGAIIPKGLSNILVVGKSASYDPLVSGSARTVPVGVAEGQAAAEMCYVAKQNNVSFKDISQTASLYSKVQSRLINKGVTLNAKITTNNPEIQNWSFPYIQKLRKQGFLQKSINGKKTYACNEPVTYQTFANIASLACSYSNLDIKVLGRAIQSGPIDKAKLVSIVNQVASTDFKTFDDLYSNKVIDYTTYTYINGSKGLYNSHAYALMSGVIDYLRKDNPLPARKDVIRNDLKSV